MSTFGPPAPTRPKRELSFGWRTGGRSRSRTGTSANQIISGIYGEGSATANDLHSFGYWSWQLRLYCCRDIIYNWHKWNAKESDSFAMGLLVYSFKKSANSCVPFWKKKKETPAYYFSKCKRNFLDWSCNFFINLSWPSKYEFKGILMKCSVLLGVSVHVIFKRV